MPAPAWALALASARYTLLALATTATSTAARVAVINGLWVGIEGAMSVLVWLWDDRRAAPMLWRVTLARFVFQMKLWLARLGGERRAGTAAPNDRSTRTSRASAGWLRTA